MFSRAAVANAREGGPGVHRVSGAPLHRRVEAETYKRRDLLAAEVLKQANAHTRRREIATDVQDRVLYLSRFL